MIKYIRKKVNQKYKKEELIKHHRKQKFTDNLDHRTIRRCTDSGPGH